MIKNIILDFGGILTGLDKERCISALHQIGAGRIAYYVDECRSEDLFQEIEHGNWTPQQFCEEVRRRCTYTDESGMHHECNATDEEIIGAWNSLITGIPVEKLRLIKKLRDSGKYCVMLLSNTNEIHWEKTMREFFSIDGLTIDDYFHHITLSYELHVVKPDARIFLHTLEKAGAKAEESIFVDDSLTNCQGAEAVGIHSIHSKDCWDWMEKIERL